MIFAELKTLLKTLEGISNGTNNNSKDGKKAIRTLRIMPILLSFVRKCPWTSDDEFSEYLKKNESHVIIYEVVSKIKSLEENEDYLALPCYFFLQLKNFYAEYVKFPHAEENLDQILVKQIYMNEEAKHIVSKKKKIEKISQYLEKNKIVLKEDYTAYKGMPQLILTSKIKLTPKNF
jgi:hypothetical protein